MDKKLAGYLNKEYECLKDILMQTKEIKKSLIKGDIDYANRLLIGRNKNIANANKYQEAAIKIIERSFKDLKNTDPQIDTLRARVAKLLNEINELDDEVKKILSKEHAKFKEGYLKAKKTNLFKKGYLSHKRASAPKLLDKKT
jgi:predicted RNase H-like nuclease (RuvC/YqgF family)